MLFIMKRIRITIYSLSFFYFVPSLSSPRFFEHIVVSQRRQTHWYIHNAHFTLTAFYNANRLYASTTQRSHRQPVYFFVDSGFLSLSLSLSIIVSNFHVLSYAHSFMGCEQQQ